MGVVPILLVTEVMPLMAVLDWSIIGVMLWEDYSDGAAAAAGATEAAGRGLLSEGGADEGHLGYSEIVGEGAGATGAGAQSPLLPPDSAASSTGYAANGRSHHHASQQRRPSQHDAAEAAAGLGFQIGIADSESGLGGGGPLSVNTASMYVTT